MAAYHCAKAGLTTLLVEKDLAPRDKCCAGGLLGRAEGLLDFPVPKEIIRRRIDSIGITVDGTREEVPTGRSTAATIDRGEFDQYLTNKAGDVGAEVILGRKVGSISEQDERVIVRVGDMEVRCRSAIVAEGVASHNANKLFGPKPSGYLAVGARAKFTTKDQLPDSLDFYFIDTPTKGIQFGRRFPVNGWMFPGMDGGNIGVCGTGLGRGTIEHHLQRIESDMGHQGISISRGPTATWPVPFRPRKRLVSRRCVAIGDAAGFASPLSGEGMTYAFRSGRFASDSIKELLNGDANDLRGYSRSCQDSIVRDIRAASLIGPVLHWLIGVVDTKHFFSVIREYDDLMGTMVNIALGDQDWRSLALQTIPDFLPLFLSSLPSDKA
ncbi:MAG: Digeranylgeranylglycerophospholipid reductase [Methanomassiliicoccales archaeon PtaU1.Bin124]|nr:MAG: Digeranylgeranylglycerophospholipid reductase [Methanomassiliicoccales archaeon PtaU1.Bin124]